MRCWGIVQLVLQQAAELYTMVSGVGHERTCPLWLSTTQLNSLEVARINVIDGVIVRQGGRGELSQVVAHSLVDRIEAVRSVEASLVEIPDLLVWFHVHSESKASSVLHLQKSFTSRKGKWFSVTIVVLLILPLVSLGFHTSAVN